MVERNLHAEALGILSDHLGAFVVRLVEAPFAGQDPVGRVNQPLAAEVQQDVVRGDEVDIVVQLGEDVGFDVDKVIVVELVALGQVH